MDNTQPKIIKFSEIKQEIIEVLNNKLNNQKLHITEKVTLVDGFVNQPLSTELSGSFVIGGPSVPMIILVGDESGQIYYFALKAILPEIGI